MGQGLLRVFPQAWSILQAAQLLISCVEEGHEEFRTNLKRQPEPIKETSRELFLLLMYGVSERKGREGRERGGSGGRRNRWSDCDGIDLLWM